MSKGKTGLIIATVAIASVAAIYFIGKKVINAKRLLEEELICNPEEKDEKEEESKELDEDEKIKIVEY